MFFQKKPYLLLFLVFSLILTVSSAVLGASPDPPVKNIIVLVTDGTSAADVTITRWYKGGRLTTDAMVCGGITTYCANSMITDSAPAATAFACGYKSDSKFVGTYPSEIDTPAVLPVAEADKFRPIANVLEAAKLSGRATGIVATSNIQHATPACFTAHTPNRNDYNDIAEQQVYLGLDVALGGGRQYLLPSELKGTREDGANLIETLKQMGYGYVENTAQMEASQASKLWGLFAPDAMAYDFDRDPAQEPSLAAMTAKAIQVLAKNPHGFFLFVEASKVDWAAHSNDPIGVISDLLAFEDAVKVALDYARSSGDTLVLAFPDHGTGGMSLGSKETNKGYDLLKTKSVIAPLKKATLTGEGLEAKLNADRSNAAAVLASYYGIEDPSAAEIEAVKNAPKGTLNSIVGPMISKRSGIGWTTIGHTGEDLFLWGFGPGKPSGLIDNTAIAQTIAVNLHTDLDEVTRTLFVSPVESGLHAVILLNATVAGKQYNAKDPLIVLTGKNGSRAYLPASTNLMFINDQPYRLDGVSLIINGQAYLPRQALDIMNGAQ